MERVSSAVVVDDLRARHRPSRTCEVRVTCRNLGLWHNRAPDINIVRRQEDVDRVVQAVTDADQRRHVDRSQRIVGVPGSNGTAARDPVLYRTIMPLLLITEALRIHVNTGLAKRTTSNRIGRCASCLCPARIDRSAQLRKQPLLPRFQLIYA